MLVRVDILDDRLEAIEAGDDRERLRRYLELWRGGAVDPLRDPGAVLVVELDDGPRPRRLVANDGLGAATGSGHLTAAAPGPRAYRGLVGTFVAAVTEVGRGVRGRDPVERGAERPL